MKSFDLNAYGVQEMTAQEMTSLNGGWKCFGRNDLGGDPNKGLYTVNILWIPVAIGYRF